VSASAPAGEAARRPRLVALELRAAVDAWRAAGFAVGADGRCRVGTTDVVLAGGEGGFAGWTVAGAIPAQDGLDGVPTAVPSPDADVAPAGPHPNRVVAIDHVVLATPDSARTFETLEAAGFELRRVSDAGSPERPLRQGFFLFADLVLEVVGPPAPAPGAAAEPARLWGVTFVADDLDAARVAFGSERLGAPRDAVQPGRRIAVAAREAGLGVRVALMTPRT
jgi:hypothetical protein